MNDFILFNFHNVLFQFLKNVIMYWDQGSLPSDIDYISWLTDGRLVFIILKKWVDKVQTLHHMCI